MLWTIIIVVVVVGTATLVAYYQYRSSKRHPSPWQWGGKFVIYGTIHWETSNFPAEGITVELYGHSTFPTFEKHFVHRSDPTNPDGYYEIAVYPPSYRDYSLKVLFDTIGNTTTLRDDAGIMGSSSPHETDFLVRTPDELKAGIEPNVLIGMTSTISGYGGGRVTLKTDSGQVYLLSGAIPTSIAGRRLQVFGEINGNAGFTVERYRPEDILSRVGILQIENPVRQANSEGINEGLIAGDFVLTNGIQKLSLKESDGRTLQPSGAAFRSLARLVGKKILVDGYVEQGSLLMTSWSSSSLDYP